MHFMVKEILGYVLEKEAVWQQIEVGLPIGVKTKKPRQKKQPYGRDIFDLARCISNRAYARRRHSMSSSIL